MAYTINLTAADVQTIAYIGDRYCWSDWALRLKEGDNVLTASEAWEFDDYIEMDAVAGHSPFPMLDPRSDLYRKLTDFAVSIV